MDSRSINFCAIAGSAGNIKQGMGKFVFGNERSESKEDSYVERYLDRISNGTIPDNRRSAMNELQALVTESHSTQMSFGAMGFSVLLNVLKEDREDVELARGTLEILAGVLKEDREDVELVRGTLETLVGALTPVETTQGPKTEVQPVSLNEAILLIPRGITVLMDMLMDLEVSTLLPTPFLLILSEEHWQFMTWDSVILVEGHNIFSIIREEGYSDGGVVVQDCLELLNNLIRNPASNQMLLKETMDFDPLISILKIRRGSAFNFTQQKTVNLLGALYTVELLLSFDWGPIW